MMGQVIHAEHRFLASKEAHLEAMNLEKDLRDRAAKAASFYQSGLTKLSSDMINGVPLEHKEAFRQYLMEYLKYYNDE